MNLLVDVEAHDDKLESDEGKRAGEEGQKRC